MQTQLLCTFSTPDVLTDSLQQIRDTYSLVYNYIYVLQNKSENTELFITYNIDTSKVISDPLVNTILIHRKKETNTLYTINALNTLIREENFGILDTAYSVNWVKFKNTIILTSGTETRRISTRLYQIIPFS